MNTYLLIIATLLSFPIHAQSLMVHYEERANIENQLKNVTDPQIKKEVAAHLSQPRNFTLFYENGVSLYVQNNESVNISGLSLKEMGNTRKVNIDKNSGGLYKNQKTNEYLSEADIFGKKFLVIDQLKKYDWKLTNEEKIINKYKVKKAKAIINGENITAWYSEEFPVHDGPEDYYGLPGLIIELNAEKKNYNAVTITKVDSKFDITKPSQGDHINKEKYNQILNETINQLKQGIGGPPRQQ